MARRNINLIIEYQGTNYAGWQVQSVQRTIQGEIVRAVSRVTGQEVNLIGAGRTDAGVHALGQVANFVIDHHLEAEQYCPALNFYLPDDIRIKKSYQVKPDFNARRDAISKRYRYLIGREKSALYRHLRWERPVAIDQSLLRRAAKIIEGEHDFTPFCVVSSRRPNNKCTIMSTRWWFKGPLLIFEIRGNRFLHGMVRSLVGAMVNLSSVRKDNNRQNLTLEQFKDIIRSLTEERVVFTAPPQGLYLVSVQYAKGQSDEVLY